MHEASIARHLIEAIGRRIDEGEIVGEVEKVYVRVGRMTAVVPDNLRRFFDILAPGSPLDGAELSIEETPIRAKCRDCGVVFSLKGADFECAECGSGDSEVVSGRELTIVGVEVG
jgi:hydrogenase nickel incorporation protein HypA/HybF